MVLSILGPTIEVTSSNASGASLKSRNQSITKTYQYSAGNYLSGVDFLAGTYNIAEVSGSGTVKDNNGLTPLNAPIGDGNDGLSVTSYQNVNFPSGDKLSVSGGVKIDLIPSN